MLAGGEMNAPPRMAREAVFLRIKCCRRRAGPAVALVLAPGLAQV